MKTQQSTEHINKITLPWGSIVNVGAGTVPTSHPAPKNSIQKMIEAAKEASEAGVFDNKDEYYGAAVHSSAR